jgi:hypothetical protein
VTERPHLPQLWRVVVVTAPNTTYIAGTTGGRGQWPGTLTTLLFSTVAQAMRHFVLATDKRCLLEAPKSTGERTWLRSPF